MNDRKAFVGKLEENMYGYMCYYAERVSGMMVHERNGLLVVDSGVASDTFNYVTKARLTDDNTKDAIQYALSYFDTYERPFSWWVSPSDSPSGLAKLLTQHGLRHTGSYEGMVLDLNEIYVDFHEPDDFVVQKVTTMKQLEDFAEVVSSVFAPPDPLVWSYYKQAGAAVLKNNSPASFYVGYKNREPVSSLILFTTGDTVGVYSVASKKEYRKQGYAGWLVMDALLDIRAAGDVHYAVLQSSAIALNIYKRLGFADCCTIDEYKIDRLLKAQQGSN